MSSTTSTPSSLPSKVQNAPGDYNGKVSKVTVLLATDRPVIFTTVTLTDNHYVTHAVRLAGDNAAKSAQARKIGLNELRSAFPNILGTLSDIELIDALDEGRILDQPVHVTIVQQLDNNQPKRLKKVDGSLGDILYNVRLRSAAPMSKEVRHALFNKAVTIAPTAASNPFTPKA